MKILMVLTSHDTLGTTGEKTGFWLEEFAAPYYTFLDAGAEITLASPAGGQPPVDPKSDAADAQTDFTRRFAADDAALAHTVRLDSVDAAAFDAVFYPGGHGPLWDLAQSRTSIDLIAAFVAAGKPTGFVCHAPGVLRDVMAGDGTPLVRGRRVTGFSDSEEAAVGLTDVVPFLLEDVLKAQGALYEKGPDWASHVVTDGTLITGQNPASSAAAASALMDSLA
jgi:putative intracellular protease/amidase